MKVIVLKVPKSNVLNLGAFNSMIEMAGYEIEFIGDEVFIYAERKKQEIMVEG